MTKKELDALREFASGDPGQNVMQKNSAFYLCGTVLLREYLALRDAAEKAVRDCEYAFKVLELVPMESLLELKKALEVTE